MSKWPWARYWAPTLLLMCWSASCVAATAITVYECFGRLLNALKCQCKHTYSDNAHSPLSKDIHTVNTFSTIIFCSDLQNSGLIIACQHLMKQVLFRVIQWKIQCSRPAWAIMRHIIGSTGNNLCCFIQLSHLNAVLLRSCPINTLTTINQGTIEVMWGNCESCCGNWKSFACLV